MRGGDPHLAIVDSLFLPWWWIATFRIHDDHAEGRDIASVEGLVTFLASSTGRLTACFHENRWRDHLIFAWALGWQVQLKG
jgi:hypothetical protein